MSSKLASYRCCQCSYEWQQPPGPTQCMNCGFLYVKWLNFESDFQKRCDTSEVSPK
jgi:hypothetical protein